MEDLIDKYITNILLTISQNPVTNIIAPTGTGKTTKLPLALAKYNNRVGVVVSDKSVAMSLTDYISNKYDNYNNNNNINYIDQNTMKDKLYETVKTNKCDIPYDILILDEADADSIDMFMIMALWRYCAEKGIRIPRLVLTSTNKVITNLFDIKVYDIKINTYPVEIRYWDKNYPILSNDNQLLTDVSRLVYDLHNSSVKGSFLIFATDKYQIHTIIQELESYQMKNINIYPAHEGLTKGEIDRIYKPSPDRKVVVTDVMGETTHLLDDMSVIIDLMKDKVKSLSLTGGVRYPIKYISPAKANLRTTRLGKSRPGLCYRIVTEKFYNLIGLDNNNILEIFRTPLYQTMLGLYENGINPYNILEGIFTKDELDRNHSLMVKLGVIGINGNPTVISKFISKLPLGMRNSVSLYKWIEKEYPLYPAIVLLSMIDCFSELPYFVYPDRENGVSDSEYNLELLEHRKRHFNPFEGISDIHTYSNIWNTMMDDFGGPDAPTTDIKVWCEDNSIRYEIILEVISIINIIINELERLHDIEVGPFETDTTMELLTPILSNTYNDKEFKLYNGDIVRVRYEKDHKYYSIDNQYSINSINMNKPETVYGIITSTIKSDYSSDINLISCSLVI
jgi:HrpA-like RNA helicase